MALVPFGSKSGPSPVIPRKGRMPKRLASKQPTSQPGEATGNVRRAPGAVGGLTSRAEASTPARSRPRDPARTRRV